MVESAEETYVFGAGCEECSTTRSRIGGVGRHRNNASVDVRVVSNHSRSDRHAGHGAGPSYGRFAAHSDHSRAERSQGVDIDRTVGSTGDGVGLRAGLWIYPSHAFGGAGKTTRSGNARCSKRQAE